MDVLIVAAGEGLRFKSSRPKVLSQLANQPIISYSLSLFNQLSYVKRIVVVTSKEIVSEVEEICSAYSKCLLPVIGGPTRYASVSFGLKALSPLKNRVAIHDAARPLLSKTLIDRLEKESRSSLVTIPGISLTDTIKEIKDDNFVKTTHERSKLRGIQTPQIFYPEVLEKFPESGDPTDEASLAEELGFQVLVVEGESTNLKITFPWDLYLAERLLKRSSDESRDWL